MNSAEHMLISAVGMEPESFRDVVEIVNGDDFENPNLGLVFDGMRQDWIRQHPTSIYGLAPKLQEWGVPVYALTETEVFSIIIESNGMQHEARYYAAAVKRDAIKRRTEAVGSYVQDALAEGHDASEVSAKAAEMLREISLSSAMGVLETKTLTKIMQDIREEVWDWVVPDLFEKGDRFVLTGHEGKGKSYLLRQLALAPAAGIHPWDMRRRIDPVDVLIVDAENTERQWRRGAWFLNSLLNKIGQRQPGDHVHIHAGERMNITKGTDLAEIHRLVDKHQPGILVIGPLYKLTDKELTTDNEAAPMIAALDSLRERGLVLLMEAHAGHGSETGSGERALRPRGSSALMGWPEFGVGLRPVEEDDTMASLVHWRGMREVRDFPTKIRHGVEDELPWMPADNAFN